MLYTWWKFVVSSTRLKSTCSIPQNLVSQNIGHEQIMINTNIYQTMDVWIVNCDK